MRQHMFVRFQTISGVQRHPDQVGNRHAMKKISGFNRVILKHTNPCGMGQGASLREAWDRAFATDNQAPFGGIIAVNQPLDGDCAEAIAEIFSEVIIAPEFTDEAKAILQKKKNLQINLMRKILNQKMYQNFSLTRKKNLKKIKNEIIL